MCIVGPVSTVEQLEGAPPVYVLDAEFSALLSCCIARFSGLGMCRLGMTCV